MRTTAKKLSAYNKHVQKEMLAGKTMKQAAKSWKSRGKGSTKKKSSPRTSPKKKPTRRKTSMAKKKSKRRSGFRFPGGLGPKGILMGALGLMVAPRIIPVQSPGAHKLAAGLGLRALKVGGGGPLAAVGLMELALQYGAGLIGGVTGGFTGSNGTTMMRLDY